LDTLLPGSHPVDKVFVFAVFGYSVLKKTPKVPFLLVVCLQKGLITAAVLLSTALRVCRADIECSRQ
jgi:hypothetical protein